jgi:ribosome biogenesis SPOUT family RNA methylase Rps3
MKLTSKDLGQNDVDVSGVLKVERTIARNRRFRKIDFFENRKKPVVGKNPG